MNFAHAERIVNAVLYEGYMLYPYRPSSIKNRQRWTFGGVYPQAYSLAQGGADPSSMQTQFLAQGDAATTLTLRLGFLHLVAREVGELEQPLTHDSWGNAEPAYRAVEAMQVGERRYYAWQEAIERKVDLEPVSLVSLIGKTHQVPFTFPAMRELEPLRDAADAIPGMLIRTQHAIEGCVELLAEAIAERVFRVTARITNLTPMQAAKEINRDAASLVAFVSTHSICGVEHGEFVSSIDPPEPLREAATACENLGAYPVLVGIEGQRDTMLSSPIILYDYPEIAPESPGDLFDGTEIDEILSLRILAMTDDEKREMAAVDERARALLERTEKLSAEELNRLHGTLRTLRPIESGSIDGGSLDGDSAAPWAELDSKPRLAYLRVSGVDLRVGDPVRLRPRGNADIMDMTLNGMTATIQAIERDFEDRVHIAVTVDDDPGREFGLDRMPGHRFFFAPEEVEPMTSLQAER